MNSEERSKRILIVEDDLAIAHLVRMQLQIEGYQVTHAADGAAGWELLQQEEPPDLIILDVLMPEMNGFELCRRIRATPALQTLPVVILTALHDASSRLEGLQAGANDFLGKPWSKAELFARIGTLLKLKEVQDRLQKRHQQLGLLYDISRELSAHLDVDQILSLMLVRTATALGALRGTVVLLAGRKPVRQVRLSENAAAIQTIEPPALSPTEQAMICRMAQDARPLLLPNSAGVPDLSDLPSRSLLAAPLLVAERLRGVIVFEHQKPGRFDDEQQELLASIARQTAISIENAGLFERVKEERQRFAALINSMDEAVMATDREQRIALVNPAAVRLLGERESDLKKRPVAEVLDHATLRSLFTQVATEDRSLASAFDWGTGRSLYATVSPVGGGGQVAVIQDITAVRQLQSMQLAAEQEKTARVRATFERYMSPALVDRALSEERGLMERRERRQAAVLFADLRGFTRLTLRFSPDDVVAILNEFFTVMTGIAHDHSGTIFDIAGDELMVGFGVPFELPDPVGSAVSAAVKMQTVFADLSDQWRENHDDRRTGMGIGIDFGPVVVGNVGSPTRMNYALVGSPVNTAHALVATAGDGEIRFSQAVKDRLSPPGPQHAAAIPGVQLKGRDQPETIYSLVNGTQRTADTT